MTHKCKIHDPMKTRTEKIMHSWGYEKITHKEKHTKRMEHLVTQIQWQVQEMMIQSKPASTEQEHKEILDKFMPIFRRINAEIDAQYLIANNIARRGKPLHPDTAIKKLNKIRGSVQAWSIKQTVIDRKSWSGANEYDLGYFLKRDFGVTIMDAPTYKECQDMINMYRKCGAFGRKELQHYENFAKKFHKSVINAALENQK